jgi:hypothetical protein
MIRCVESMSASVACSGGLPWGQGSAKEVECSGVVLDMQGQTVAGAVVVCSEQLYGERRIGWGPARTTTSGEDGRFRLRVPAQRKDYVYAFAWKKGYSLGWQMLFHVGASEDWVVRLAEPTVLAGLVVDEGGRAIAGATVRPCLNADCACDTAGLPELPGCGPVHTDDRGRFRFEGIPRDATADFWVEAEGKTSRWTFSGSSVGDGLHFRAGRTDVRIVLRPEATLRG